MPEPLEINLKETADFVKEIKPDIAFVQDPDADRLVLINEQGEVILEELTVTLAMKSVLSRGDRNVVVTNLSTTKVFEEVAKSFGVKTEKTKVGEANVVQKMIEVSSTIGGEGSGGVIYTKVGYFRDSLSGMALILELMARENKKISDIVEELPKYIMKKEKFTITENLDEIYKKLKDKFTDAKINTEDGIRFDWENSSWVHIRASNTEPIVRVFGEAKEENEINSLFNEARLTLGPK
jgi:phosphomannomutase